MNVRSNAFAAGCSLAVAVALQAGCATTPKTATPAPQPAQQSHTKAPAAPQILAGKVVETMNSGGYTYINLDRDGKTMWVAVPPMKVEVGQELKLDPGMPMGSFTSKTLNRTFDNIIFSSGPIKDASAPTLPKVDPNAKLPAGHPALGEQMKMPQGHPATDAQNTATPAAQAAANADATISGKVAETMDSGGYTYINVEKGGKSTWVAIPVTEVKVGQEVTLANGPVMTNFKSKSLNRTFETVIFSSGTVQK